MREKRPSGRPCSLGSSQAMALTSATCSGGETARATRARLVREALETVDGKASSPAPDQAGRGVKAPGDLGVGHATCGVEHDARPQHLLVGELLGPGHPLQHAPLLAGELDPISGRAGHRRLGSSRPPSILQTDSERFFRTRLLVVAPARRLPLAGRGRCDGESPCRPGWATMEAEMPAHPKQIEIATEDRPVLEKWANARATERRLVDRARIVLLAAEARPATRDRRAGAAARCRRSRRGARAMSATGSRVCAIGPRPGRPLTHGPEVRAQADRAGLHPTAGRRRGRPPRALDLRGAGRGGRDVRVPGTRDPGRRRPAPAPDRALGDERARAGASTPRPPRSAACTSTRPENAIVVSIDEKTVDPGASPTRRDTSPAPGPAGAA